MHAGPAWDFDVALGNYAFESPGGHVGQDYVKNAPVLRARDGNDWFTQLFRNEEFVVAVNDLFESQLEAKISQSMARLDSDIAAVEQSAAANFTRWSTVLGFAPPFFSGRTVVDSWTSEASQLRSWAAGRIAHLSSAYGSEMPVLRYSSHVASIRWQPTVTGGLIAGTSGKSLQLEALDVSMVGARFAGELQSRVHVQGLGWTAWQSGDTRVGTTGQSRRFEAVQFRLTGDLADRFDISYRTHVQDVGWVEWVRNGTVSGTTGRGLRVESAQVRLLDRDAATSPAPQASLEYNAHVADIGWMASVVAAAPAGTTGRGLAMQALRASVSSDQLSGGIEYRAHAQNRGWLEWTGTPNAIGTTGLGLRLEAIEARLTGDLAKRFDLQYQAHVQGIGWQDWVANGATASTTGQGLQIEALRIELVPKAR